MLSGMINNLDYNIGRIISCIDENDLAENTIVIFSSDNGPTANSSIHRLDKEEWKLRNPHNFKGNKGNNWENGIKSPLFIRWKGKYKPTIVNEPVQIEDIFPTILELSGNIKPDSLIIDGKSMLPVLNGGTLEERLLISSHFNVNGDDTEGRKKLYKNAGLYMPIRPEYRASFKFDNQLFAVRAGDFKYVMNQQGKGKEELYNTIEDPRETNNLVEKMPDMAKELREELKKWFAGVMDIPEAFQMPEFLVGYKGRVFNLIPAVVPSEISDNLINSDHLLMNWKEVGDFADYKVNVITPGRYKVSIIHEIKGFEKLTFEVIFKNNSVSSPLTESQREFGTLIMQESAYWDNYLINDSFRKTIVRSEIGFLNMAEGKGKLKIALADINKAYQGSLNSSMIGIQLQLDHEH
jgi:hypothetical protein